MAIRHNPALRSFFKRVMRDDPDRKKIALVATAHYLCRIMAAMLRTGEAWRRSDPSEQKDGGVPPAVQGAPPRKTAKHKLAVGILVLVPRGRMRA